MIRYIAYIGPKEVKSINIANGRKVAFPQGVPVDIVEAGMEERKARHLLRTGLFRLHGEQSVPFDLPEPEETEVVEEQAFKCPCGFLAKNKAGLKAHMRYCRK